jgi:hypothetical protein
MGLVPQVKKPMEQVTPQGVSGDYVNELMGPLMDYRDLRAGIDGVIAQIRANAVRRYTERFPPAEFEGVVTAFNRESVTRLDAIADELNSLATSGTLSDERYRALHSEACKLLFGPQSPENFGDSITTSGMGLDPQVKKPMVQVTPQGVSGDYYNELIVPLMMYRDFHEGINGVIAEIQDKAVRRYTERFPPAEFEGVVTAFNREAVTRLDAIADELNSLATSGTLSDERYRALHSEACKLLFGSQREENFGDSITTGGSE